MKRHWKAAELLTAATGFSTRRFYATFAPPLTVSAFGRYIFAYALACTVGVFWEFLEFFTDTYWHTHVQQSLHETMSDLVADAVGAAAALAFVCLCRRLPLWFKQRLASKG